MPRDKCILYKGVLPPVEWSILFPPLYSLPPRTLRSLSHFHETSTHTHSFFPPGPLSQPVETLKKNPTILRSQRNTYIRPSTLFKALVQAVSCARTRTRRRHTHASFSVLTPSTLSHPCSFYLCPSSEFVSPFVLPILRSTTDSVSLR